MIILVVFWGVICDTIRQNHPTDGHPTPKRRQTSFFQMATFVGDRPQIKRPLPHKAKSPKGGVVPFGFLVCGPFFQLMSWNSTSTSAVPFLLRGGRPPPFLFRSLFPESNFSSELGEALAPPIQVGKVYPPFLGNPGDGVGISIFFICV